MGLDITAYSKLELVGKHTEDWCDLYETHVQAFAYDSFPRSFRGIEVVGNRDSFIEGGCYAFTDGTETHAFRAGSYSGYGRWRNDLAAQFNPAPVTFGDRGPCMAEPDPNLPFYELIWFADNEGTIGPEAAADLLADFRAHATAYEPGASADYFRDKYTDWTRACELAANSGLISFH